MCAHFCYKWCIVGYLSNALWDGEVGLHGSHDVTNHVQTRKAVDSTYGVRNAGNASMFYHGMHNIEHLFITDDNKDNNTYPRKWLINRLEALHRHIWRIILTAGVLLQLMIFTGVLVYTLWIPVRVYFLCYIQIFFEENPPKKVIITMYHHSCSVKVIVVSCYLADVYDTKSANTYNLRIYMVEIKNWHRYYFTKINQFARISICLLLTVEAQHETFYLNQRSPVSNDLWSCLIV